MPEAGPSGKTTFNTLINRWALGVKPEQNTIERTRMHARRFQDMVQAHTAEEVTRQHAILFIDQLRLAGQTPQNINMHLASLIKLLNYAVRLDCCCAPNIDQPCSLKFDQGIAA